MKEQDNLFKLDYKWYYIVSLCLKVFAAFSIFLLAESILGSQKKIFVFLSAVLFLVGYTGIQNTDWAVYMIVYFATALFILSIFYKHKFLVTKKNRYLVVSFFLVLIGLISSSIRLFPVIIILPTIDLLVFFSRVYKINYLTLLISNCVFILSVFVLWLAGLFGTGTLGKTYTPGNWSLVDFTSFIKVQPIQAFKTLFHLIGVIIVPDQWAWSESVYLLIGLLVVFIFIKAVIHFKKSSSVESLWLLITLTIFLTFLLSMWYFSPSRLMSSGERYLFLPFTAACLLIAVLASQPFFSSGFMKKSLILVFIFLILTHWSATRVEYSNLLAHGRDSRFVNQFDSLLFKDIQLPVSSKKYIYLDFDDGFTQHSILFGLGFKILVLSRIWNSYYDPIIFDQKNQLFEAVQKVPYQDIFSYQLRGNLITNTTADIRKELISNLNK